LFATPQCSRRVEQRAASHTADPSGWSYPTWPEVQRGAEECQPRSDDRLIADTAGPIDASHREVARYLGL
jgi:hypothetical protein